MEIFVAIITGGALVAIIEGVREFLSWRRNRKAIQEDRKEAKKDSETDGLKLKMDALESKVDVLVQSQKFILFDRIRFLGQAYIEAGEIDFDDRRILNDMHRSYHDGLQADGDLDALMDEVNHLPLKIKH